MKRKLRRLLRRWFYPAREGVEHGMLITMDGVTMCKVFRPRWWQLWMWAEWLVRHPLWARVTITVAIDGKTHKHRAYALPDFVLPNVGHR
jgi:hypothetical protein